MHLCASHPTKLMLSLSAATVRLVASILSRIVSGRRCRINIIDGFTRECLAIG